MQDEEPGRGGRGGGQNERKKEAETTGKAGRRKRVETNRVELHLA